MVFITVKQLYKDLKKRVEKGQGDYPIFISDDEEGNGFHGLFYTTTCAEDEDEKTKKYLQEINCDIRVVKEKDKVIYLG